jgi:hypothetical protein
MYKVSNATRYTSTQDGGVLLHIRSGKVFRLNPIGILILDSFGSGKTEDAIINDIADRCKITAQTIQPDVLSFLHDLEQHGLVEQCCPGGEQP